MRRVAAAAAILGAIALTISAQQAPVPTGRVVADTTGDPIPHARVSIVTAAHGTRTVRADEEGRFALPDASGGFRIVVTKFGYARREVTPAPGQPIAIRLQRSVVVSGRVVDEFGEPAPSVRVGVSTPARGKTPAAAVAETQTDDLGEYRLAGLVPGPINVWAETFRTSPLEVTVGPPTTLIYYPGAGTATEAETLTLRAGEDQTGIDFSVRSRPFVPAFPATSASSANRHLFQPRPNDTTNPFAPGATSEVKATAVLRGYVTATDGRVIVHANVRLVPMVQGSGLPMKATVTDDLGAYEFTDLAASTYRIVASKPGFAPIRVDDPASAQPPFGSTRETTIAEGETRERTDVRLARWGTLSGRIVDELGDPMAGASVQVLQIMYRGGRRRLGPRMSARLTDDLGRYRLFGVAPGQYIVSATVGEVSSADVPGYASSYYPGTPNAGDAQFVPIGQSQDVTGVDFAMSLVRTARITGTVFNADGEPTSGGALRLLSSSRSASPTDIAVGARVLRDGRFEFPNVAPGQYVIQADRGKRQQSIEGEFGTLAVAVNGEDVTDLNLEQSEGSSISGRFTFDSYDPSKQPASTNVELVPVPIDLDLSPSSVATAAVADDWTFEISGLHGPRRLHLQRAPAGWMLKEIRVAGIDVTDRPLAFGSDEQSLTDVEVVLTDRVSRLTGTVSGASGRPAAGASVVVFSTDRDRWFPQSRFVRRVVAAADGTFTIAGLPGGSYDAIALPVLPSDGGDSWQDPDFLEQQLPRVTPVIVRRWRERRSLTPCGAIALPLSRARRRRVHSG